MLGNFYTLHLNLFIYLFVTFNHVKGRSRGVTIGYINPPNYCRGSFPIICTYAVILSVHQPSSLKQKTNPKLALLLCLSRTFVILSYATID